MILARSIAEIRNTIPRPDGRGLVPTMGALHEGHAELIRRARTDNEFVVVTIFVNPTQFNRTDDFERYPRDLDTDLDLCNRLGVDAVFAPEAAEMYPETPLTSVDVADISARLEGEFRPGHFRGVTTVVAKLFNIVPAERAYFGEKDAQQLAVIRRMVADLNFRIEIVPVPTVREADGLALSSRNRRLTPEQRAVAPALYQALQSAAQTGDLVASRKALDRAGFRVDYFETARFGEETRILTAAWLGEVRLIDNVRVPA